MKINILNKQGYLTKEDRKEKLERGCEYSTITTNLDLTEPLKVVPYGSGNMTQEQFGRDVAIFISFWTNFVLPDLNGFSGLGRINFDLSEVNIIKQ